MNPFCYFSEKRNYNSGKLTFIVIVALCVVSAVARLLLFPHVFWGKHLISFVFSVFMMYFLWAFVKNLNQILDRKLPYEQGLVQRLTVEVTIGLIFIYVFRTGLIVIFSDYAPIKIDKYLTVAAYIVDTLIILFLNARFVGVHFFREWKKVLLKTERLQKEQSIVQFENLKNQLNPHFLFNSLTSLNSLIFENQQLASQFLQQLSKVYRYVLQNKEKELVNISTEVAFIENYIFLLQTRFYGSLQIILAIDEKDRSKQIVPVTLQILIENAIKHNIVNEEFPLTIRIYTDGNSLLVTNNLQRKSIIETSNKMGLENMRNLYSYLSPAPMEVVEDTASFTVKIPLL